jgi:ribonuclease HI
MAVTVARPRLELYCDGSGEERVGRPGGWAFLAVRDDELVHAAHGAAAKTTSLVMELEAVSAALRTALAEGWHVAHEVVVVSDSRIALEVADGHFMPRPVAYRAQAEALRALAIATGARTKWVRGHAGHRWNEAVDALAHRAKVEGAASQSAARRLTRKRRS